MIRMAIKDANISGASIIIDEVITSPLYYGCLFAKCSIHVRYPESMQAFANCNFTSDTQLTVGTKHSERG